MTEECSVRSSARLSNFVLQKGLILPDAKVVYATLGRFERGEDNVVLFPTWRLETQRTS